VDNLKNQIEKYLKGELSPSQMHELEMRALHDPFLSDALEGATTIDPEVFIDDVKSINEKINRPSQQYYWPLRIAASIILIVSISYLVIQFAEQQSTKELAIQDSNQLKDSSSVKSDSGAKSLDLKENLLSLKAEQPKEEKPIEKKFPKEDKDKPTEGSQAMDAIEPTPMLVESDIKEAEKDIAAENEIAFVEDRDDEMEKKTLSKADAIRSRSETSRQSSAPLPSSISGAGASMKSKDFTPVPDSYPRPTVGEVEFKKYLNANHGYPQEALKNKIEGEVIIGFNVNANGELTDFTIEKGIGFGCDEELLRLIKNGPAWAPAQINGVNASQKTTVSFVFHIPK